MSVPNNYLHPSVDWDNTRKFQRRTQVMVTCNVCQVSGWRDAAKVRIALKAGKFNGRCIQDGSVGVQRKASADMAKGVDYAAQKLVAVSRGGGHIRTTKVQVTCCECGQQRWLALNDVRHQERTGAWTSRCRPCAFKDAYTTGGRLVVKTGYVSLGKFILPEHQWPLYEQCRNKGRKTKGLVMEHRWVMALHLGRPLTTGEVVHHINGKRDDNRLENLRLFTRKQHHAGHDDSYDALQRALAEIERLKAAMLPQ